MAYTTDRTWVAGEVVTAAYLNTYLRDNVKWLSTDKPMCRTYNTPGQSVAASSTVTLTYNTDRFDNADLHATTGANTNRITIPTGGAGKYVFGLWTGMPGQATPGTYHAHAIRKSGTTSIAANQVQVVNSAAFGPYMTCVSFWSSAAADWFDSSYAQDGGGALTLIEAEFWAVWIGV